MFSATDVMHLAEHPTVERRGDRRLVIFPSRPYWFIADGNVDVLLDTLRQPTSLADAVAALSSSPRSTGSESVFREMLGMLHEAGVLKCNGALSASARTISPRTQITPSDTISQLCVTRRCNLRCKHCYVTAGASLENELTTAEIFSIVDQLEFFRSATAESRVSLTGGEPFVRPDVLDLIAYIADRDFGVTVATNALQIRKTHIAAMKHVRNLALSVSLDGAVRGTHEAIRGRGTFDPTIRVIHELTEAGITVGLNMFVYGANFSELEALVHLGEELGVRAFNCINAVSLGRAKDNKLAAVPEEDLIRAIASIVVKKRAYYDLFFNSTFCNTIAAIASGIRSVYCGVGSHKAMYIRSDGNVYPCPNTCCDAFALGNVRKDRLSEIWTSSPTLKALRGLSIDRLNQVLLDLRRPVLLCWSMQR